MKYFRCRCEILTHLLNEEEYFKLPWQSALHWLQCEMDRVSACTVAASTLLRAVTLVVEFVYIYGSGYHYAGSV